MEDSRIELLLTQLRDKVDGIADEVQQLKRVVIGNGDERSLITRLVLLEQRCIRDHKTIEELDKKVDDLESMRNRLIGGAIVLSALAGAIGAAGVKLVGG
jgi:hypothetical protein